MTELTFTVEDRPALDGGADQAEQAEIEELLQRASELREEVAGLEREAKALHEAGKARKRRVSNEVKEEFYADRDRLYEKADDIRQTLNTIATTLEDNYNVSKGDGWYLRHNRDLVILDAKDAADLLDDFDQGDLWDIQYVFDESAILNWIDERADEGAHPDPNERVFRISESRTLAVRT